MRKLLVVVCGIFALILVTLLVVPLFIDVNKFRPTIVSAIEQNLNAEAELGRLSLHVFPRLNVGIEKLVIYEKGVKTVPVFAVNDAKLDVALLPLFAGKADVIFRVKSPQVNVVKGRDGKMNVMRLMKPSSSTGGAQPSEPRKKAAGRNSFADNADIGFEMDDGRVTYVDEFQGTKTSLSGLSLALYHIGTNKPIEVRFKSTMDVKGIKDLTFAGAADLKGTVGAYMKTEGFDKFTADLALDATDLTLKYGALFNKTDKTALKLETKFTATADELILQKAHVVLKDLSVDTDGIVKNFSDPVVNMHIRSSKFVLEDWKQVIGMLGEFDTRGNVGFDVRLSGPVSRINIDGSFDASGVGAKLAALTQPISNLNAKLKFTQNSAELSHFAMNIGSSDVSAHGTINNFNKPNILVALNSKLLDLDAMLPKKTPDQVKAEEELAKNKKEMTDAEMEAATKGPLDMLRKNAYLRGLSFDGKAQLAKVRMNKADITDIGAEVTFMDLVLGLRKMSAKAFAGTINATTTLDFKPLDPTYKFSGEVAGLDINAAITSQMESLKDTVLGKTFAKFDIAGAGVTKTKVKQTLVGKGGFRLEGGAWSALKVLQQVGDKLASIPQAKDKLGGVNVSGRIRKATSDFSIGAGRFNILNLVADLEESNTGLTGQGFVDFDKNLALNGKLLVPASGVPQALRASDGRAALPYEISCQATAPCFKAETTLKPVAEAYGKEELKKAASQGVQKLKEAVKDENAKKILDKIDNSTIDEAVKKLHF